MSVIIVTATNRISGKTATVRATVRTGTSGIDIAEITSRQLYELRSRLGIHTTSIDPSFQSPDGFGEFELTQDGGYSAVAK